MVLWGGKAKDCPDLLDKLADLAVEALEQPMLMMRLLEKRIIERALQTYGGNQYKTADFLGCHRNTLARRMKVHGIHGPRQVKL